MTWTNIPESNPRYEKPYYKWYRLDKNILWFNVYTFIFGLIYSFITFECFRKFKVFKKRFHISKIWLPPVDGRRWL